MSLGARRFVKGLPAHNILFYGDRAAGKSSTVKALLNELVADGLCLVENTKNDLVENRGNSSLPPAKVYYDCHR